MAVVAAVALARVVAVKTGPFAPGTIVGIVKTKAADCVVERLAISQCVKVPIWQVTAVLTVIVVNIVAVICPAWGAFWTVV